MVKVYIIEDFLLIIEGINSSLKDSHSGIKVAGFSTTMEEALQGIPKQQPDIILYDLYLDRRDPVENFMKLRMEFPSIPIVILTTEDSLCWKWRMMLAGARGYVPKIAFYNEMQETVLRVMKGETVQPYDLISFLSFRNKVDGLNEVTEEELDLIRYRKDGAQYKEIAALTGKSVSAIEKKFAKLCEQFNMPNTQELLRLFFGWPVLHGPSRAT